MTGPLEWRYTPLTSEPRADGWRDYIGPQGPFLVLIERADDLNEVHAVYCEGWDDDSGTLDLVGIGTGEWVGWELDDVSAWAEFNWPEKLGEA